MRKKRISMDKIREIIRLYQELNLGCRKIAQALSISKTAVNQYIAEFRAYGLSYQDIPNLTDSKLSELLSNRKRSINDKLDRTGITILMSNRQLEPKSAIFLYRRKDRVKKFFNSMKNDMDRKRLRIHSRKLLKKGYF